MNSTSIKLLQDFYSKYPLQTIFIKGKKWEYVIVGKGERTFVILPGGGETAQRIMLLLNPQTLATNFKIIAITFYNADSIQECCEAIDVILEKENVRKIILFGHSIGGELAQSYFRRTKSKNNIEKIIILHACTPNSEVYKKDLVRPFKILHFFLPLLPTWLITKMAKMLANRIQGISSKNIIEPMSEKTRLLQKILAREFFDKYLTKRQWQTWYLLHMEFAYKEKFSPTDLKNWQGKILIMQTDNDPWMRDGEGFRKLYPKAKIVTFHGTGHLTFYYQYNKVIETIKKFL